MACLSVEETIDLARRLDLALIGTDPHRGRDHHDCDLTRRVALCFGAEGPGLDPRLASSLATGPGEASFRCLPTPGSWAEVDDFGSALIPQQIVQAIVAFLDAEPRR